MYVCMNIYMEVKDLYDKNYELVKKFKTENIGNICHSHGLE